MHVQPQPDIFVLKILPRVSCAQLTIPTLGEITNVDICLPYTLRV